MRSSPQTGNRESQNVSTGIASRDSKDNTNMQTKIKNIQVTSLDQSGWLESSP